MNWKYCAKEITDCYNAERVNNNKVLQTYVKNLKTTIIA